MCLNIQTRSQLAISHHGSWPRSSRRQASSKGLEVPSRERKQEIRWRFGTCSRASWKAAGGDSKKRSAQHGRRVSRDCANALAIPCQPLTLEETPDAKSFFHLEGWNLSTADPSTTTYLECIAAMQRHNATVAWQVAGGSTEAGRSKVRAAITQCSA